MSRRPVYHDPPPNEAVRRLRALDVRLNELARRLDASKAAAHEWRQGTRTPDRGAQERIARSYHIPTEAWEQPPSSEPLATTTDDEQPVSSLATATPNDPATDVDPATMTNLESVNRLLREIRNAAADPNATPTTREKLTARELTALRFRHECEMRDLLTQDRIVAQHKEWRVVRDRLAYVVGNCCEPCCRMIIDALVELGV